MLATVETYGALNQALSKRFQGGVEESLQKPGIFKPLYKVIPSTSKSEVYQHLNGCPTFREWVSGTERVYRNIEETDFAVTNKKYEATISVDLDRVDDNQIGSYGTMAESLGMAASRLQEKLIGQLIAGAFASTKTADGQYWISDTHAMGQSNFDNLTTGTLSFTTFATAYQQIRSFTFKADKDSYAEPVNTNADLYLIVPQALELTARDIVALETRNEATYSTKNPYYNLAKVIVNGYATSTTAWMLMAVTNFPPIYYQERQKPVLEEKTPVNSDTAFNRDCWIWGAKARGAALPTFPWQVVGSLGTT